MNILNKLVNKFKQLRDKKPGGGAQLVLKDLMNETKIGIVEDDPKISEAFQALLKTMAEHRYHSYDEIVAELNGLATTVVPAEVVLAYVLTQVYSVSLTELQALKTTCLPELELQVDRKNIERVIKDLTLFKFDSEGFITRKMEVPSLFGLKYVQSFFKYDDAGARIIKALELM